ncbi:MAG: hypothetical protein V4773_16640 [Verrucomicrobiota bacterium]
MPVAPKYKAALWHILGGDRFFVVPADMDEARIYLGHGKFDDRALCQATSWANAQLIAAALNEFPHG